MGRLSRLKRYSFSLVGLGVAAILAAAPAFGVSEGRGCRKVAVISNAFDTSITSVPCHVCSVSYFPTGTGGGWAEVYDSPGTASHAQVRVVAEPGSATKFNSVSEFYGEQGRWAFFGLGAYAVNGTVIVHYDD